ncbi:uncharacterized protein LOC142588756 [Dermacentor variabilis]|uniref:uncharacterized protein LOC142588756 n=1 Tax=Dermacentor variabilis TaxID=34621 RepID=UPI003F5B435E
MGDASTADPSTAGGSEQSMVNKDAGGGGGGGGMIILLILLVVGILAVVGVLFATGALGGAKHATTTTEFPRSCPLAESLALIGLTEENRTARAETTKIRLEQWERLGRRAE